jgi:hypothetical protein
MGQHVPSRFALSTITRRIRFDAILTRILLQLKYLKTL